MILSIQPCTMYLHHVLQFSTWLSGVSSKAKHAKPASPMKAAASMKSPTHQPLESWPPRISTTLALSSPVLKLQGLKDLAGARHLRRAHVCQQREHITPESPLCQGTFGVSSF